MKDSRRKLNRKVRIRREKFLEPKVCKLRTDKEEQRQ